ncbi:MAG: rhomboid family intramembrane serine protease [Pseudomonadota bacterium]
MSEPSPFNELPPVVWALFFLIMGIELMFWLGASGFVGGPEAIGWRLKAVNDYGFSGQAFDWMIENERVRADYLMRFVTYPFVHGAMISALLAGVILLAMGKLVGEVMGSFAVIVLFFLCGILGAAVLGLLTDEGWLYGAYPCVYGLIGAYTFLLWQHLSGTGLRQLSAFRLIGVLMALQLIFGIFIETGLAWIGELAGFAVGFLLSPLLIPGGMARVLDTIRRR